MKKYLLFLSVVFLTVGLLAGCSTDEEEYNYISADEVKAQIESDGDLVLLDIQVEEEFNAHHIQGAVATYAYPTKTDEDKAKLAPYVDQFKQSEEDIVIVCPAGGGGATRTFDYFVEQGVPAERVLILEEGQKGWPYEELLAQ